VTGAEVEANYFGWHIITYLVIIFAVMIGVYQLIWSRKCSKYVKVLVVKSDGSTETEYAPKSKGYVALTSPNDNTTRLWPISKLSAVEEDYPGDGFIPKFLQKKIKMVIVDEVDWEPLLNRGSYSHGVASPDVVRDLRDVVADIQEGQPEIAQSLTEYINSLATAPTREMVASPAVLGNIVKEKVSEMAVTISKDTFDRLDSVIKKLDKIPNAMIVYIGLGVIAILVVVSFMQSGGFGGETELTGIRADLQAIKDALGAAGTVVP